MLHSIRFFRNTASGETQALCTCGWAATDELEALQAQAAVHDLNEESPKPPEQGHPSNV